uniref:RRM domain-containing protein n=1 Tax=Ditylenchus dipsaci TaxID=166011 RepID=A0A915DWI6_9BILA
MLREHFSQFGTLLSVKILRNEENNESPSVGYVVFADKKASDRAVNSDLNVIDNKTVSVSELPKVSFVVRGLSLSATEESLHAYFSQFGKISHLNIKPDPQKGISQAYVYFTNEDEVDQELTSKTHVIDGKEVYVAARTLPELIISLENLSPWTTTDSLTAYFSRFGQSILAQVNSDQRSKQSSGLGFVYFSSKQQVENAMRSRPHIIDGRKVILNRMVPFRILVLDITSALSDDRIKEFFKQFGFMIDFSSQKELQKALDARPHVIDGIRLSSNIKTQTDFRSADVLFVGGYIMGLQQNIAVDKKTGRRKGYAFVKFAYAFQAAKALLARPLIIDGVQVDVKQGYGFSEILSSNKKQEKYEETRYRQSDHN